MLSKLEVSRKSLAKIPHQRIFEYRRSGAMRPPNKEELLSGNSGKKYQIMSSLSQENSTKHLDHSLTSGNICLKVNDLKGNQSKVANHFANHSCSSIWLMMLEGTT